MFCIFTPNLGEDEPILANIFSDGLKPSSGKVFVCVFFWGDVFHVTAC